MSTEAAARGRAVAAPAATRTFADRFLAALPLLSVFVWLAILYGWEAWDHQTPWLFTDELLLAQLGRSIAHHGHPMLRNEPASFHSLYPVLTAPAWLLPTAAKGYEAVKYIGVFAMTLTLFPAYFLARIVASPRASLAAAAGATAIPAVVYSSFVIEEPIAYPWAALCLFLIAKVLLTRGRWWSVGAVVASILAPLLKGALTPIPGVLVVSALLMAWSSDRGRAIRARWSVGDYIGVAFLAAIVVVIAGGIASDASFQYLVITRYRHGYLIDHAFKATGALMIGIGILPLVAAFGMLFRVPGEEPRRELRVVRCVLVAALLFFGLYTGIKGGYNQYSFATRVWERNMIYVAPLLFAATALWFDRRRINVWSGAVGAGLALFLVLWTPYLMAVRFSSDTPGLAILGQANRTFAWSPGDAKVALLVLWALCIAAVFVPTLRQLRRRVPAAIAAAAAVVLIAWNLTGELAASAASNAISRTFIANIRNPTNWLEQHTRGAHTLYLGQQMRDQNGEWLLEFWNPSLKDVWSLDGTAQGPGRVQTPDVTPNGELIGKPPSQAKYIVVESGIDPDGAFITKHGHTAGGGTEWWRLYKIRPPLRLLGAATGLFADHWSSTGGSAYTRYAKGTGSVEITLSRPLDANVMIRMGTLTIGSDAQPHIGRVTKLVRTKLKANDTRTITVPTPARRFRVEVQVGPLFVPAKLYPGVSSDQRELGAITSYRFVPRNAAQQ
jgi:hypothetical protein